ncbi:MAG: hypothetical protein AAF725_10090 [Acidobacteriota bacterium]
MGIQNRFLSFALSCGVLCLAALPAGPAFAKDDGKPSDDPPAASFATAGEAIERFFDQADLGRVPTGLLLEKGAYFTAGLIESAAAGEPVAAKAFDQAYHELRAGAIDGGGVQLPEIGTLSWRAQELRHRFGAVPISFVAIRYTSIGREMTGYRVADDVLQLPAGPLGDKGLFVAPRAWTEELTPEMDQLVVPTELLALHGIEASELSDLRVQLGGFPEQSIRLDQPFTLDSLAAYSGKKARLTLRARLGDEWIKGSAVLPVALKPVGLQPPPTRPVGPRSIVECRAGSWTATDESGTESLRVYDLIDPVVGAPFVAPWNEPMQTSNRARVFLRLIPGDGRVGYDSSARECDVALVNPVVVLDGFDFFNQRDFESVQRSFGSSLKKLQAFGFDIILVDYTNGRDWIQRNGEALRTLMVNRIPELVVDEVLEDDGVAIVGGSMGSRVAQYGLSRAETFGEDHNTGLFIAIDGPFAGANIPIGFQAAAVDLAQFVSEAGQFRDSLESPAASQLLARTYPRGAGLNSSGWYAPRPEFFSLNAQLSGVLPNLPRNVAAANGSGPGSTQSGLSGRLSLLSFEIDGFIPLIDISVDVWSDGVVPGNTKVYDREFCLDFLFIDCLFSFGADKSVNGLGLDLAAGGYRQSTQNFLDALDSLDSGTVTTSFVTDRHSFVAPASVIGAGEPWDSVVSEKCNKLHGPPTASGFTLAMTELLAFRSGATPPPQPPAYATGCGVPEPAEYCYPAVVWYEDPDDPELIEPWADPVNCYVHPIPGGQEPISSNAVYATDPGNASCPNGGFPGSNGCPYFQIIGQILGANIDDSAGILSIWTTFPSGITCPMGTSLLGIEELEFQDYYLVTCSLPPVTAPGDGGYELIGSTIYGPPDFSCSSGIETVIGDESACFYGVPPEDTSAFGHSGSFYYEGAD